MRAFAICVCAIFCSFAIGEAHELIFTINKSWDGQDVALSREVTLKLIPTGNGDLELDIEAPYFGDPAPTGAPGLPFLGLWDYEVVEAFFLNDQNQYLEVELGPHGQHIVLLLNGERNTIRHSLPLNVTTKIMDSRWHGTARIPKDYFPPQVTKFNAYAIHGAGDTRTYMSLYPTDGSTTNPDFHNLNFFRPINTDAIFPDGSSSILSGLWESAIQGIIRYTVSRQWHSGPAVVAPSEYSLQGFQGGVEMNYTIKENTEYLFSHTVFAFENARGEAVKITLFRDGKSIIKFYQNRNEEYGMGDGPPIDYRIDGITKAVDGNTLIRGSVMISPKFFPANVNLINIYALFGTEVKRVDALEPLSHYDESFDQRPQLENLRHFTTIDFDNLVESNTEYSPFWKYTLGIFDHSTSTLAEKLSLPHEIISNEHEESEITRIKMIPKVPDVLEKKSEGIDVESSKSEIDESNVIPITTEILEIFNEESIKIDETSSDNNEEVSTPTESQVIDNANLSNAEKSPIINIEIQLANENQDLPITTESLPTIISESSVTSKSNSIPTTEIIEVVYKEIIFPKVDARIQEVDEEIVDYDAVTTEMPFVTQISQATENLIATEGQEINESTDSPNNDIVTEKTNEEIQINIKNLNINAFDESAAPDVTEIAETEIGDIADEEINTEKTNTLALETFGETKSDDDVLMDKLVTDIPEINTEMPVTTIPEDSFNDILETKLRTDLDDATTLLIMPEVTELGDLKASEEQKLPITEIPNMETQSTMPNNEIVGTEIPVAVNSKMSESTENEVEINTELETRAGVTVVPEIEITVMPRLTDLEVEIDEDVTTQISPVELLQSQIEEVVDIETELTKGDEQTVASIDTETTESYPDEEDTEVSMNTDKQHIVEVDISIPKTIETMNREIQVEVKNRDKISGEESIINISDIGTEINQLVNTESSVTETPMVDISQNTNQPEIVDTDTPIIDSSIITEAISIDNDRDETIKHGKPSSTTTVMPELNSIEISFPTDKSEISNTEIGIISHITDIINENVANTLEKAESLIVSKISQISSPKVDEVELFEKNVIDFSIDIIDSEVEHVKPMDIQQERDQVDASATLEQTLKQMQLVGAIPVPDGFMPTRRDNQFDKPLAALLAIQSRPVPEAPHREKFKRRFEETNIDKNVVLILNDKFLVNTEKKFEDYPQSSFDETLNFLNQLDDTVLPAVDIPQPDIIPTIDEALENVFNILNQDNSTDLDLEFALDTLTTLEDLPNETNVPDEVNDVIESVVDDLLIEDILPSLPPPPRHHFCSTEGLVADRIRCQVFYECVIENGQWAVYDWRCKRGYYYDEQKVACIRGIC